MRSERVDLAAVLVPFGRRLMAMESEVLAGRQLSMWEYVILSALVDGKASSQLELATRIGHDKSRMISDLQRLEVAGFVQRQVAEQDRRTNRVALTPAGRRAYRSAQREIHGAEDELLRTLSREERALLVTVLERIAEG